MEEETGRGAWLPPLNVILWCSPLSPGPSVFQAHTLPFSYTFIPVRAFLELLEVLGCTQRLKIWMLAYRLDSRKNNHLGSCFGPAQAILYA